MSILTPSEFERIHKTAYNYINLIQRLENPALKHFVHRVDGTFVVENNGFLIPYLEPPFNTPEIIDHLFHKEIFGDQLLLAGLPKEHFKLFEKHPSFEIDWNEPCLLYVYEKEPIEIAQEGESGYRGLTLDHLREADLDTVFEYYAYKDDGIDYIREIIKTQPTFCLRDGDTPVSWLVRREDGSMGIMYTMENYRQLGIGIFLSQHMINKILDMGQTPYLHIHHGNIPSIRLAESLGFRLVGDIHWFGVIRKAL